MPISKKWWGKPKLEAFLFVDTWNQEPWEFISYRNNFFERFRFFLWNHRLLQPKKPKAAINDHFNFRVKSTSRFHIKKERLAKSLNWEKRLNFFPCANKFFTCFIKIHFFWKVFFFQHYPTFQATFSRNSTFPPHINFLRRAEALILIKALLQVAIICRQVVYDPKSSFVKEASKNLSLNEL